jgi:hypothetical protein
LTSTDFTFPDKDLLSERTKTPLSERTKRFWQEMMKTKAYLGLFEREGGEIRLL